jgi:polygalacturonase
LNTSAIVRAIAACAGAGGGTVDVPAGVYLTGPFTLLSNLNLHLERGATILFGSKPADFPRGKRGYENGILADHCHDIAITGDGTIDGNGSAWWARYRKRRATAADVDSAASPGSDSRGASNSDKMVDPMKTADPANVVDPATTLDPPKMFDPGKTLPRRPCLVVFDGCQRVRVQGVTLTDSPSFHLVPAHCQDVTIDSVKIVAPANSPNTDGIDPSGWNFLITRCRIDVGDDCIAIKPSHGGDEDAGSISCENFTISNCTFLHGHGMSVGGQTPGGLNDLLVRDCTFEDTAAGIRLKAGRGQGGLVEHLTYENLTMTRVRAPILITSYYPDAPKYPAADPPRAINATTPIWRHIRITRLRATNCATAGMIVGLPEMPVEDVLLSDVHIAANTGMQIVNAAAIRFDNSTVSVESGEPILSARATVSGINSKTGRAK